MQKPAQVLSLLQSQLTTSVLALPADSLVLSDEACPGLSPFTMILCPGFFSLEHLRTCILPEQPCVGDLRELSLWMPELMVQNMWQEVTAFTSFWHSVRYLKLCLVGCNPVALQINTTKGYNQSKEK